MTPTVSVDMHAFLQGLMSRFTVDALRSIDAAEFEAQIRGLIGKDDSESESYADPDVQRDLSVRYHWGHNHDFGAFALEGRMHNRHIDLLAAFIDELGALPISLVGKRILDIGCWTGGTSLLLAAMGAEVVAVEEVNKYADTVRYLADSFGLTNLQVRNASLYDLNGESLFDSFDYVLYAGVHYHVSDPILALRILFNALRDGGTLLVETASVDNDAMIVRYEGPSVTHHGSRQERSRGGWNWFTPSPVTMTQMLLDVGFEDVISLIKRPRMFATAVRKRHVDFCRAGLSVRTIR